jgi:hypothetical protein
MADIKFSIFADGAAAEKEIVRLGKSLEKLQSQNKNAARSGKSDTQGILGLAGSWQAKLVGIGGGYISITHQINMAMEAQRKFNHEIEEGARKQEEFTKKFNVQSGLRGLQGKKAQASIVRQGIAVGATKEEANAAAIGLVRGGFPVKEATGGALKELLLQQKAMEFGGKDFDPGEAASAMGTFLQSQGMGLNEKNLRDVGRGVQRTAVAFHSPITHGSLRALAAQSGALKGVLTPQEQVGTMAELQKSGMESDKAAGALGKMVLRLRGAKGNAQARHGLALMHLKPEDVDFVGETEDQVLDRLAEGKKKAGNRSTEAMGAVFGRRGLGDVQKIVEERGEIRKAEAAYGDQAGFMSDANEATTGKNAGERRMAVTKEEERANAEGPYRFSQLLEAERMASEARGENPWKVSMKSGLAEGMHALGFGNETSINTGFYENGTMRGSPAGEAKLIVDAANKNGAILQKILDAIKAKPQDYRTSIDRFGQSE